MSPDREVVKYNFIQEENGTQTAYGIHDRMVLFFCKKVDLAMAPTVLDLLLIIL